MNRYTGILDISGIEIIEGDIIKRGYMVGVVCYVDYEDYLYLIPCDEECIEDDYRGMTPYEAFLNGGHTVEFDSIEGLFDFIKPKIIGNIGNCDINQFRKF